MIPVGSRYERGERNFVTAHIYNSYGYPILQDENPNLKIQLASRDALYMPPGNDPVPTDNTMEYYVKDGEDFSLLAFKFMGDSTRWTDLAYLNPQIWYPLDAQMGDYIKVSGPT